MSPASPPKDPKEIAMRSKIISHMNADHQDSLSRYLQHQYQLSEEQASSAELIDINFKQVVVKANKQCYTLAIVPPMFSFSEARGRLVDMDHEAREALGLPIDSKHNTANGHANGSASGHVTKAHHVSDTVQKAKVNRYVPPTGIHLVVFLACISTFVVFARPEHVRPGGFVHDRALKYAPGFADFCQRIQFWLFSSMVALHGGEAGFMGFGKLRKYGVPIGSSLWLKWTGSCFIDGVCSLQRLDQLVKGNREKEQHSQ